MTELPKNKGKYNQFTRDVQSVQAWINSLAAEERATLSQGKEREQTEKLKAEISRRIEAFATRTLHAK